MRRSRRNFHATNHYVDLFTQILAHHLPGATVVQRVVLCFYRQSHVQEMEEWRLTFFSCSCVTLFCLVLRSKLSQGVSRETFPNHCFYDCLRRLVCKTVSTAIVIFDNKNINPMVSPSWARWVHENFFAFNLWPTKTPSCEDLCQNLALSANWKL